MPEGSSEVDTGVVNTSENDSENESIEENEAGDESSQEEENQGGESQDPKGDPEKDPELTSKGTKLDKNPQSAVHQELANANRLIGNYETVLKSPELLRKYAEQNGMTLTEAKAELKDEKTEIKKVTAENLKTSDDVANTINDLYEKMDLITQENTKLKSDLSGMSSSRQNEVVANTLSNDINAVREKYPELNPKKEEFDKELEQEIGEIFHDLDFDESAKSYKGKQSLLKLTNTIMGTRKKAMAKGSKDAQTNVIKKKDGKVVTSSKPSMGGGKETTIAQRIALAMGN